jgi:hypothetical protein
VDWEVIAKAFIEEFVDRSRIGYSDETLMHISMENIRKALEVQFREIFPRKQIWFVRLKGIFCKRG